MNKAVLFLTYNRLDYVKEVFEQIRIAQPPRLYVASDGPRDGVEGEAQKVQEVRDYILNNIDWDCEVKTRFLDKNSGGCAAGVSGAVTWFFENEKDGIILEDDCVPTQSFFKFCEILLDKYKNNKKVWHITGDGACPNLKIKESYYFAKIEHCWGWASWADRWKYFSKDLTYFDKKKLKNFSNHKEVQKYWENILDKLNDGKIDSWAYPWTFNIVEHNGLCINPVKNLVKNIGIIGEHYSGNSTDLGIEAYEIDKIIHPLFIKYNREAIYYIYKTRFRIKFEDKIKSNNEKKLLGIPFSSVEDRGEYKISRTFFNLYKKKKSKMYSKYYFLGIQIWCKKKSKIHILMEKVSNLEKQTKKLKEKNKAVKTKFQKNISNLRSENASLKNELLLKILSLQSENDNLKKELQEKVLSLQNENNNLKNKMQQNIISLRNEFWSDIISIQNGNNKLNKIPVFMASDDNYAPFLCTAMYSMLENTNSFIDFYILDGGISLKSKNFIADSLNIFKNYSVEYINMAEFDYSRFPNQRHYSLNTFSRYFIPYLKPDIDKAIYIDCDVIINGDISKFYNIDMEGKALVAIPENFYLKNGQYVKEHINPEFENTENYFNAGVMLLNIRQFVQNDYSKILVDKTIELAGKLSCPDQDIFNIVFEKNHKLADYKYNYMPDFYEKYKKVTNDVENLDNNAIVYHYTCGKPWKNGGEGVRKSELFWNTLKKTEFFKYLEDYKAITLKS